MMYYVEKLQEGGFAVGLKDSYHKCLIIVKACTKIDEALTYIKEKLSSPVNSAGSFDV